jgi:hypothetical protein
MKKLILLLALTGFISSIAQADILPPGQKVIPSTLKVQGLSSTGKTADGSILVLLVRKVDGHKTVTKIQNNQLIDKGYKFNDAVLFFVSAKLLASVKNDITKIDFATTQTGLTTATIEVPAQLLADQTSPVTARAIVYTIK